MAGGANVPSTAAAEYTTTQFAKQGELGTQVLRPRPTGTVWKRGTVAYARQQSTAPHGGGYIFRLCPANESLTEDCFNQVPLEFATPEKHTLRFADSKLDREINATLVTGGGGKGWMVWPWPGGSTGVGLADLPFRILTTVSLTARLIYYTVLLLDPPNPAFPLQNIWSCSTNCQPRRCPISPLSHCVKAGVDILRCLLPLKFLQVT